MPSHGSSSPWNTGTDTVFLLRKATNRKRLNLGINHNFILFIGSHLDSSNKTLPVLTTCKCHIAWGCTAFSEIFGKEKARIPFNGKHKAVIYCLLMSAETVYTNTCISYLISPKKFLVPKAKKKFLLI